MTFEHETHVTNPDALLDAHVEALSAQPALGALRRQRGTESPPHDDNDAHNDEDDEPGDWWIEDWQAANPHPTALREQLAAPNPNGQHPEQSNEAVSTWRPIDLRPLLAGDAPQNLPTILRRTDGHGLFYPGRVNSLFGQPETGKSWIALAAILAELTAGAHVLYIDFEDVAQTAIDRLRALGTPDDLIVEGFHFVMPGEPITAGASWAEVNRILEQQCPTIAVIDGVTEAMVLHGLKLEDNNDIVRFLDLIARPIAHSGCCVIVIDHVVKSKEDRDRWAIGGQAKLAGLDGAAIRLETITPFGRGRPGLIVAKISKDRVGHLRAISASADKVALIRFSADPDEGLAIHVEAPDPDTGPDDTFRPTRLMERASHALLTAGEPLTTNAIIRAVPATRHEYVRDALHALVTEGYVERHPGPRGSQLHILIRPFHETDEQETEVVNDEIF